ncbi:hypothetical protein PFISCL1PPCAC_22514 [Pristionchus fissidentatus]|uniref:Uncharacterized protein n=1 Tax=Pristionchus fissidentatus TaxID=1538716 RepID=A0AAV5WJP8_9BILA|nr:hypothetical protein PFISCL1PPCAC_22514 [Pristionchus fissidentatus]
MSSLCIFAMLLAVSLANLKDFPGNSDCDKSQKKLMYIYEERLNDCFAVRVNACDEKATARYYSLAQCIHKIAAVPRCAAGSLPRAHSDGDASCDSNDLEARRCPKGSVCKGNICCDANTETDYLMEKYITACDPGVKASRENGQILFSRNCSIDFCPEGAQCTMGRHFAFCCPPF